MRKAIDAFLGCRRVALVGVSREPRHFSRVLLRAFVRRGYEVIPVNPALREADGIRAWARVAEIEPLPEAVLIATRADAAAEVVRECAAAGLRRVWLYKAAGKGAAGAEALDACSRLGIEPAVGCPLMFFQNPGFPHNLHAALLRWTGRLPQERSAT